MASEILGDKKKRRYDEGLIDLVNAKYAEEVISDNSSDLWVVEDESHDTGNSKSFTDWLKKFHEDGKVMASMGDLYKYFKMCKEQEDHYKILKLHEDFEYHLMGNTRMIFFGSIITGQIGHNFSHAQTHTLSEEDRLKLERRVRTWDGVYLTERSGPDIENLIKINARNERLLKATFETSDNPEEILSILEYISGAKHIGLLTPSGPVRNLAHTIVPILQYGGSKDNSTLWLDFSHLSTGRARALK